MPLSFPLTTIFYIMALLAAALTVFGAWGAIPAVAILGFWVCAASTWQALDSMAWATVVGLLVVSLLMPVVSTGIGGRRRNPCLTNLREISIALQNYHDIHGSFPPAVISDSHGMPMHSWRVLILPYLGMQSLYDRYRMDEPWNGPNNKELANQMPSVFRCPGKPTSSSSSCSDYFAIVGEHAAWHPRRARTLAEFRDGASNTIQVIEVCSQQVNWLEPRDFSMEEAIKQLTTAKHSGHQSTRDHWLHSEHHYYSARCASFADGHVSGVGQYTDARDASAIITLDAQDIVDDDAESFDDVLVVYHPNYARFFFLTFFIALALLPAFRIKRLNPRAPALARESSPS